MKIKDIKKKLLSKGKRHKLTKDDYLSTGSTLLNLACTGKPERGFAKGKYYRLVGDSSSGKTWLSLTCLAEAARNPNFDNFRFIYDNSEDGAMMDIERFFGSKVEQRMEPPRMVKGEPVYSNSIEEFYYHVDDAIEHGRPFIYILDSMDSLTSKAETDKFKKLKNASRSREAKGNQGKETGSYGDGKARVNSGNIRRLIRFLSRTGSILIVISQTRDSFDMFNPKTCSGGKALKFYACMELWSSIKTKIKRNVRGKDRELGTMSKVRVKKNRQTGRDRTVLVPIYHSYGIDDTGGMVDFLVDEKHWSKKAGKVVAKEFELSEKPEKPEKLIRLIEKKGLVKELRQIVTEVWNEIEEACTIKRERRYE